VERVKMKETRGVLVRVQGGSKAFHAEIVERMRAALPTPDRGDVVIVSEGGRIYGREDGQHCGQCGREVDQGCCGYEISENAKGLLEDVNGAISRLEDLREELERAVGERPLKKEEK